MQAVGHDGRVASVSATGPTTVEQAWERRRIVATCGVVLLGAGLSACGSPQDGAASRVAQRFGQAAGDDPAAACALLAPATRHQLESQAETSCPAALRAEALPGGGRVEATEVAGHSAQVRMSGDTIFLALFDEGWRVTAAGCERTSSDPQEPYECAVEGR